jgi:hypothetical protein
MRTLRGALILVALVAGLAGCTLRPGPGAGAAPLFGKWVNAGGESIQFDESGQFNGHLKYGRDAQFRDVAGWFSVADGKIQFDPEGDYPMTWRATTSNGGVTFTYVSGGAIKMDGAQGTFERPAREG